MDRECNTCRYARSVIDVSQEGSVLRTYLTCDNPGSIVYMSEVCPCFSCALFEFKK